MKAYEPNILDYMSTKGGKQLVFPPFADKLSIRELIPRVKRKRTQPTHVVLREQTKWEKVLEFGYNRTLVTIPQNTEALQRGSYVVELLQVVSPWDAKKLFPNAIEVRYAKKLNHIKDVTQSQEKFKFSLRGRYL